MAFRWSMHHICAQTSDPYQQGAQAGMFSCCLHWTKWGRHLITMDFPILQTYTYY